MDAVCMSGRVLNELSLIYFIGEHVYSTNGYALVRNKISEISNFTIEELELLNGRCLYYRDYKNILNYDTVDVTNDGLICHGDFSDVLFTFAQEQVNSRNIEEKFDDLIKNAVDSKSAPINEVGFDLYYIDKIRKALYGGERCILDYKENNTMLIRSIDESTSGVALLMCIALRN